VPDPAAGTAYRCVTGHPIPAAELSALTEVWTLDEGAEVRVCREHGAPIAVFRPGRRADAGALPSGESSR
jgi:hypothetical protein